MLLAGVLIDPAYAQERSAHKAEGAAANFGISLAVGGDALYIGEPLTGGGSGAIFMYTEGDEGWQESQRLEANAASSGDGFGWSMALEGSVLVVGAPARDNSIGAAYVFRQDINTGVWAQEAVLSAADGLAEDRFGHTVAICDDVIVVGAPSHNRLAGAAYVFRQDATTGAWAQEAKLVAPDGLPTEWFGWAVAVVDSIAIIGAPFHDGGDGAAYLFEHEFGTQNWTPLQKLDGSRVGGVPSNFGHALAVSLSNDHIMVGAPAYDAGGAVFIYDRNEAGAWTQRQVRRGALNDNLGWSLAVQGEYMVIGALGEDNQAGAAHIIEWVSDTGNWAFRQKLVGSAVESGHLFGSRVAVTGQRALAWSQRENQGDGAVYLFKRDATGTNTWREEARFASKNARPEAVIGTRIACEGGQAGAFPCDSVDLLAYLPPPNIGGPGRLNDIWGWTDPASGKEYALVGRDDGTAFIDVSSPRFPTFLGVLPTHTVNSGWRDIKTYADHAFIVSEAPEHGMQVFDLTQLRTVSAPPVTFAATAHYSNTASAHNIGINEESGFAYIVGARGGGQTCGGGLHMVDIRTPTSPTFAGCFTDLSTGQGGGGYTHDVQCVIYQGPDAEHQGKEICIGSNENAISIADVSDKSNPVALSVATYPNVGYTHQGWLTEDHRHFFLDDEADEFSFGFNTRTLIWDFTDLDDPQLLSEYFAETTTTDHNQYVVGNFVYQANYSGGLRILDITTVDDPVEVGFFDTSPGDIGGGAWSVYPFFESGLIVVSGISEGLFVVAPAGAAVATEEEEVPEAFTLSPAYPNPFNPATTLMLTLPQATSVTVTVYDMLGRAVAELHRGLLAAGVHPMAFSGEGLPSGTYLVRATGAAGFVTQTVSLVK